MTPQQLDDTMRAIYGYNVRYFQRGTMSSEQYRKALASVLTKFAQEINNELADSTQAKRP